VFVLFFCFVGFYYLSWKCLISVEYCHCVLGPCEYTQQHWRDIYEILIYLHLPLLRQPFFPGPLSDLRLKALSLLSAFFTLVPLTQFDNFLSISDWWRINCNFISLSTCCSRQVALSVTETLGKHGHVTFVGTWSALYHAATLYAKNIAMSLQYHCTCSK
jgi:hypothetical protein